jgi:hypothetical protein
MKTARVDGWCLQNSYAHLQVPDIKWSLFGNPQETSSVGFPVFS